MMNGWRFFSLIAIPGIEPFAIFLFQSCVSRQIFLLLIPAEVGGFALLNKQFTVIIRQTAVFEILNKAVIHFISTPKE